jgi:hypothetical protein
MINAMTWLSAQGCEAALTHVRSQGVSPSRLRATVVQLSPAFGVVPGTGLPIADGVKYGGQGSRAWSPPV